MSEIGNVYARYGEALNMGLDDFERSRRNVLDALQELYDPFIRSLICNSTDFGFENDVQRAETLRIFGEQFNEGRSDVSFTAIDGTCGKEQLSELMVFYGASYAQNGTLNIGDRAGKLSYSRWTPSEDTSFVAYLPIPLNALSDFDNDDWLFRADDEERSTVAMIHTGLMQLAEIFLAYKRVTSEDRPPKIVLLDHSLSSILLSSDVMHLTKPIQPDKPSPTLGWIDAYIPRWGRNFAAADGLVAHAHPMDRGLGLPSFRYNALAENLVAEITNYWQIGMTGERDLGRTIPLTTYPIELRDRITQLESDYGVFEVRQNQITPIFPPDNRTLRQRWYDLRLLFEDVCDRLFRERRIDALKLYYTQSEYRTGSKWMDDNDVRFLCGVGLRLLIEICRQKRVLLIGVVKDSSTRFFFKNFLSVVDKEGLLRVPRDPQILGTDRTICEMLPLIDNQLSSPWSTLEFDSAFMTTRALISPNTGNPEVQGVRGDVIAPSDGMFMRSLVHLFLERRPQKNTPLMGHVLFMDRITYPYFDGQRRIERQIRTERGSTIRPMINLTRNDRSRAHDISLLLVDFLTRNLFREAIGQPDPLHRADLGAKALGKQIHTLVLSSVERFKQNPLSWSFRTTRDGR